MGNELSYPDLEKDPKHSEVPRKEEKMCRNCKEKHHQEKISYYRDEKRVIPSKDSLCPKCNHLLRDSIKYDREKTGFNFPDCRNKEVYCCNFILRHEHIIERDLSIWNTNKARIILRDILCPCRDENHNLYDNKRKVQDTCERCCCSDCISKFGNITNLKEK